jgi:DNA-binding transcriptional regulator GbsR (MarR family)
LESYKLDYQPKKSTDTAFRELTEIELKELLAIEPEKSTETEPILLNKLTSKEPGPINEPDKVAVQEKTEEQTEIPDTIPKQPDVKPAVEDSLPKQLSVIDSAKIDTTQQVIAKVQEKSRRQLDSARLAQEFEQMEKLLFMRKNFKTIRNLKKIYPYALKAREILQNVSQNVDTLKTGKERRQYLKQTEKELLATFRKDVENMTFSQGKLLLKLIDRETDQTAYTIIKDYRGVPTAIFWQGVARIFGANLKTEYDPAGADSIVEKIVKMYEKGELDQK